MTLNRLALAATLAALVFSTGAFAQDWSGYRETGHSTSAPDKDGNTTETANGVDKDGNTVTTTTLKGPDGRAQSQIDTFKDKNGKITRIRTQIWGNPDRPWELTFGYVQDRRDDQPDREWDPKKGEWINRHDKAAMPPQNTPGVVIPELKAKQGTIRVFLPSDMAAGDTISGTVVVEPNGKNDKERLKNEGELEGCVVEVGQSKGRSSQGLNRWIIPAGATMLTLTLLDKSGHAICHQTLPPLNPAPAITKTALPMLAQAGRPLTIPGNFDGDAANTSVSINGQPVSILAESPRESVIFNPKTVVGPAQIEIHEGNTTTSGAFRSLKIDLTAPKTSLLRGESTELHVQVSGLEGIKDPIGIQLSNGTPGIVQLSGGDMQVLAISPTEVDAAGNCTKILRISSVQAGGFSIGATLCQMNSKPTQ